MHTEDPRRFKGKRPMAMSAASETVVLDRFRCDETGWMSDDALLRLDTPSSAAPPSGLRAAGRALLVGMGLVLGLLGLAVVTLWLGDMLGF